LEACEPHVPQGILDCGFHGFSIRSLEKCFAATRHFVQKMHELPSAAVFWKCRIAAVMAFFVTTEIASNSNPLAPAAVFSFVD
jgi:hypothetical protein